MAVLIVAFAFLTAPFHIHAKGSKHFLTRDSALSHLDGKAFKDDIINAMGSMLGCGGVASPEKVLSIRKTLEPMWRTLPKTSERIDRRSLRYLMHRYFMQTSSLMVRGFEPTRPVNESHWGAPDILSQMVPAYAESLFESHHAKIVGFSLEEAVSMVSMLNQLIFDSESQLLMHIYKKQRKPTSRSLSYNDLLKVLESYMVQWLVEGSSEDIQMLLSNRTLLIEVVPLFDNLMQFAQGRVKMLRYSQQQGALKGRAQDIWSNKYSFEDAHEIVGGITETFQSFWQSECSSMKEAMAEMDIHNTGRVPLPKFYNTAMHSDWRFGESESYLRELGALDESSTTLGTQVIISNYIQATSNCIVSTSHYHVCCRSECEAVLGDIELALGSPTATPAEILPVVGNITVQSIEEDDESPQLEGTHTRQLEEIASAHGGVVPLHGRLFAQWLHFVFPRDCPFPHRMGLTSSVTPSEFGDDYVASEADLKAHSAKASASGPSTDVAKEELHWMSQWSDEEEFIVDYTSEFGMSWEKKVLLLGIGLVLLVFGITGGVIGVSRKSQMQSASKFLV